MEIKELLTRVNRTIANNRAIKYIVIHYVGAVSTAYNNAKYFENVNRQASAHYFVDDNEIYRVVEEKNIAWHCGTNGTYYSNCRNSNSIGIEMCCYNNNGTLDISENIVNRTIELVKELMAKYNIPIENVIRHYDVTHKCCPAPFVNNPSRWENFKNRLDKTTNNTTTSTISKKSNEQIADEVIAGKWGNGADRFNRLAQAGYDGNAVQSIVNQKLSGSSSTPKQTKKSNETISQEVINGVWGNGDDRKNRLIAAGYDYNAIQAIVNQKLTGKSSSNTSNKKSNEEIANEVIAGKWGNGDSRKTAITNAGYDYNAIQKIVNSKLK